MEKRWAQPPPTAQQNVPDPNRSLKPIKTIQKGARGRLYIKI